MNERDAAVQGAWRRLIEASTSPARANVGAQVDRLARMDGAPGEVAERLIGQDGAAAQALVVLGAQECDVLLTRLAAAARTAAPVLEETPEDYVAALVSLGVASSWNDILCAGRRDLLPETDPAGAWLRRLARSPAGDDPEIERHLAFVVPAVGDEEVNRALAEAGRSDAPVPQPEDVAPDLAAAVLARGAEAVSGRWHEWLASAPGWLEDGLLEWQDLLWAARAVYARLGGEPVGDVVGILRATTIGETA
jgi:hypothetical protein